MLKYFFYYFIGVEKIYAIKVWLTKNEKDWFLLRDLKDGVIFAWSRKEKAENILNALTCFKAEITEDISPYALARSNQKKQLKK